jgi:hypothetical protein
MGEWLALIDRRYYKRNLFSGLDHAPPVGEADCMLVADRDQPAGTLAGIEFTWLKCEAIDFSTPYRGLAVIPVSKLPALEDSIAVYRPASSRMSADSK